MRLSNRWIACALSGALLAGCADTVGLDVTAARTGVLQLVGYSPQVLAGYADTPRWKVDLTTNVLSPREPLSAPDTVDAGVPFDVTVTTIGLSGCWRAADQSVRTGDGVVTLTPSDVHSGADVCTEILLDLTHTSTVVLGKPGEWRLRVEGRRVRYGNDGGGESVTVEKVVVVR